MTETFVSGVLLCLSLALAVLALLLYRQWRCSATLREQLEAAATDLHHLQQACSRFAPAGVLQHLIADGVSPRIETAPERKMVTVLFADLVDSTAMSDRLEPAALARVLNGYFQRMSDAIHDHYGHVSHFLGDGIVAYFGALQQNPWQCNDAVRAALAMRAAIHEYNVELARDGMPPLGLGIGIDRGLGLVGLVGSRERMEYDFVGRTVNMAARVQSLTRNQGVDILITEALRAELDPRFVLTPMPPESVKGFADPVRTYAVQEGPTDGAPAEGESWRRTEDAGTE
jgi:adenylate cyclase